MDFVCLLLLWVLSFALFFINKRFWHSCKKECLRVSANSFYIDLIFQVFQLRIILYYTLPAITRFFYLWKNDYLDHVTPFEIVIVYFFELISHIIYYLVMYNLLKQNKKDLSLKTENNKVLEVIAVVSLLLYCYFSISGFSLNGSSDELPSDNLWMIKPLMTIVGSVSCFYVFVLGKKYWGKWIIFIAFCTIVIYLGISFFSGVRGTVFWPIIWMFFCAWYFRKEIIRKYLFSGLIILVLLGMFQGGMVAFRNEESTSFTEFFNFLQSSKNKEDKSLLEEIDYRFGALTRYSVGFIRMTERGYYAGLNPVINSFYSPIPRSIMPDKPVPCSANGDLYSMGMYLCVSEIVHDSYSMVEFSTAAHSYWEIGVLGLLLYSAIPAFYIFFSIKFFRKFDLLGPCFFFSVLKPWGYNDPKIWVSEIIMQIPQIILISYLLLFLYRKFKPHKLI